MLVVVVYWLFHSFLTISMMFSAHLRQGTCVLVHLIKSSSKLQSQCLNKAHLISRVSPMVVCLNTHSLRPSLFFNGQSRSTGRTDTWISVSETLHSALGRLQTHSVALVCIVSVAWLMNASFTLTTTVSPSMVEFPLQNRTAIHLWCHFYYRRLSTALMMLTCEASCICVWISTGEYPSIAQRFSLRNSTEVDPSIPLGKMVVEGRSCVKIFSVWTPSFS